MLVGLSLALLEATAAGFHVEDNGGALTLFEDGAPVLTYHHEMVGPPEGVHEHYRHCCHIHPLYDLDGLPVTDDFPDDHYHHRGVFWAWPYSKVGDRRIDLWHMDEARHRSETWQARELSEERAVLRFTNRWAFDEAPDQVIVREQVRLVVHPAAHDSRSLDFTLKFTNVSDDSVTLLGAKGKGYGGLNLRPAPSHAPREFTTQLGPLPGDADAVESPWADLTYTPAAEADERGVAIFQHPANPDYPHPGWVLRHYGFLGASWPALDPYVIAPGDSVTLRYRVYIHRGDAEAGGVAEAFAEFAKNPF